MKLFFMMFALSLGLIAKAITPNDVYTLSTHIQDHMHFLLKYYDIKHNHEAIMKRDRITHTQLKPRHTWQKTYEILVKINMQRQLHKLARIEPVGIEATLELNPDMVYEMNQRILTELKLLEIRNNIKVPHFKLRTFDNKVPIDNYNTYVDISAALDELNKHFITPSHVYAESMRIYDNLSSILRHLNINDTTLPDELKKGALPSDALQTALLVLDEIAMLQKLANIPTTDFSEFKKANIQPNDVFVMTGLIISELQTIMAYIGLTRSITPSAIFYSEKKPENVEQLMRWNLKKLQLIKTFNKGER